MFFHSNFFPHAWLWFCLIGASFASCEQQIDIYDPAYEGTLNLYGILSNDSVPVVYVTATQGHRGWVEQAQETFFVAELEPLLVSGSQMIPLQPTSRFFYDHNTLLHGPSVYSDSTRVQYYQGAQIPQAQQTYTLKIPYRGDTLTATTRIPSPIQVDAFRQKTLSQPGPNFTYEYEVLEVEFQDEPGVDNVYALQYGYSGWRENTAWDTVRQDWVITRNFRSYSLLSREKSKGHKEGERVVFQIDPDLFVREETTGPNGERIRYTDLWFRLVNQNAALDTFQESLLQQQTSLYDPFAEPVFLKGNVSGGRGFLGAISRSDTLRIRFYDR